jgi:hypothetical protein
MYINLFQCILSYLKLNVDETSSEVTFIKRATTNISANISTLDSERNDMYVLFFFYYFCMFTR